MAGPPVCSALTAKTALTAPAGTSAAAGTVTLYDLRPSPPAAVPLGVLETQLVAADGVGEIPGSGNDNLVRRRGDRRRLRPGVHGGLVDGEALSDGPRQQLPEPVRHLYTRERYAHW